MLHSSDSFAAELLAAIDEAYPKKPWIDNARCINEPPQCNGGGYDGCACGPYPSKRKKA